MRFFRHGDVLAIALPESLRKKMGIREEDEYDFFEVEDGLVALVKKEKLPAILKEKTDMALRQVAQKTSEAGSVAVQQGPNFRSSMAQPAWAASGFTVLEDESSAKALSQQFESLIKSGHIRGVRGFDKKFYLATSAYYETTCAKILAALKEKGKTAETLSADLKVPLSGCLTVLYLLKEEGEVLEKKRGEFSRV